MQDIFDQIADEKVSGDIFDQITTEKTPKPASQSLELKPGEQFFYESPAIAGGTPGLPSLRPEPFSMQQSLLQGVEELPQKAAEYIIKKLPESIQPAAKIAAAPGISIDKTLLGIADWATTPSGATQLVAAGIPATKIPMAIKFFHDMAKGGGESASNMIDAWQQGDFQGFSDALVGTLANLGGAAFLGTGAAKGLLTKTRPTTTEESYASSKPSTEGVPGPQVRAGVDETTPLRQSGEAPKVSPPEQAQAPSLSEEAVKQVGGIKFDALHKTSKGNWWQFTVTEPGRETSFIVPEGSTPETVAAKKALILKPFIEAEAENAPKPATEPVQGESITQGIKTPQIKPQEAETTIQKPLTSQSFLSRPLGATSPEEWASLNEGEMTKLANAAKGGKVSITSDATKWALNNPEADINKLESLKAEMANRDSFLAPFFSQWYGDAIHALKNDEVGKLNIASVSEKSSTPKEAQLQPKFRVGNSPQLHSIVEKLPATDVEISNGEQPVRIRNDKTGQELTVLQSDLTEVKPFTGTKPTKKTVPDKLKSLGYSDLEIAAMPKAGAKALAERGEAKAISIGPGAKTVGEPKYAAISQLVDQLKANPEIGTAKKVTWAEQMADSATQGRDAVTKAIGKMVAMKEPLRDLARGVRTTTDLDREIGKLDWALQQSSGKSMQAKRAIKEQFKNQTMRDASMIWLDAGKEDGETQIKDALGRLPEKTSPRIRRAMEMAANMPEEAKDLARSMEQYYSIRGQDALESGVMEELLTDYATHIWKKESNMPEELKAAITNGRVSTYFQFARQRKIPTFIEGILNGKTPELDAAEVIPFYNYKLDQAIASRAFVHNATETLTEKDGRPTFAPSGLRKSVGKGETPDALLINPRAKGRIKLKNTPETVQEEADRLAQMNDYRSIDHPAMKKWKWAATDENGAPIFYQADLVVHPDAYERISRMMDRGKLTPSRWGSAALRASTEVKGAKLGLFSLFHPVHVMSHALWHWTNPFRAFKGDEINWDAPETKFAVEKGHLKLAPNPHELNIFSEGILQPGLLIHKIPGIGDWSRANAEWTFTKLIPQLKIDTFNNAYARSQWMKKNMGMFKDLSDEEIAARTGDSVNNAFGELNHWFLGKYGRSPQFQRILRGIFLAPDFGEARLRFAEKGFTRFGHEERLAIATMFVTMYSLARISNYLNHKDPEWDWKHAFSVKVGQHWWSMRSVVSDADRMIADFGRFMYVRLNPLYARTASDILIGRDPSGRKLTPTQKYLTRPIEQLIPIQFGALTRDDQKLWESFITAMGVQAFRDTPVQDMHRMVSDWKKNSKDPKLRREWEREQTETFGPSDYQPLRFALQNQDLKGAWKAYQKLIETEHKPATINEAMLPNKPFSGSYSTESKFKQSLDSNGLKLYQQAKDQQNTINNRYHDMLDEFKPTPQFKPTNINNHYVGEVINRNGVNYKVISFDSDGEPLVQPTQ